jgi:aminomethyltransferase
MVPFAGWEMPVQYAGVIPEHLAVRTGCGAFDVSHMGQLHVEGPAAEALLQRLLSNDLTRIDDGEAQYTLLTNERGGIVDDLIAYRIGPGHFFLVVNAGNRAAAFDWLKQRELRGSQVRDASDEYAMLAVQGPRSLELLGLEAATVFTHAMGELDAIEVMVCRTGYTGEIGVELICSPVVPRPAASARAIPSDWRSATRCTETTSRNRQTRSPRGSAGRVPSTKSSPGRRSFGGCRSWGPRAGSSRS